MASEQDLGIESNGDEKHTLKLLQRLKDVTQSEICRSAVTPLMRCLPKSHGTFQPRRQDTNGCNQGNRAGPCAKLHERIARHLKQAATGFAHLFKAPRADGVAGALRQINIHSKRETIP